VDAVAGDQRTKPVGSVISTRAPSAAAISRVPSVLCWSTTMISSHQPRREAIDIRMLPASW